MAASVERSCSMIVHYDKPSSQSEIKEALEGSDDEAKVVAMKKAVTMLLNGEPLPQLFITIVRYVLPSENHTIQKLLLLYLVRLLRLALRHGAAARCLVSRRCCMTCICCSTCVLIHVIVQPEIGCRWDWRLPACLVSISGTPARLAACALG